MAAEYFKIHPENPQQEKINRIVEILRKGGVIIYPTDTIYGLGCDIFNSKAVEKVCRIKGIKKDKSTLSFICDDLSQISEYTRNVSTPIFKLMKKALPGPFTFILDATSKVPKSVNAKRKTIGIRIPDHNIPRMLVKELGNPIITTSIRDEDEFLEYSTDPELIYEKFSNLVDAIIDGGFGNNIASTIVDCSGNEIEVVRQGMGDIEPFL
ncbi:L-threonylcarbamoyladenylate synthase [Xanthovirga aplysinae]|uniref:L-threonylcarbamoyladenylate synthase n=1 Tax=Xanthovirga aplysinae TaxID=2529853 RepID=UPI0012BCB6FD|nr:L-threonylcarbamoyladenylate synthase [Xanthovirga aplysinae]MTI31677.1 threonylcarbamoyl-AMP synthase [Xanthovirga aplysinae]